MICSSLIMNISKERNEFIRLFKFLVAKKKYHGTINMTRKFKRGYSALGWNKKNDQGNELRK